MMILLLFRYGIIHMDVKLANCLLDLFGHLKLADFNGACKFPSSTHKFEGKSYFGTSGYLVALFLSSLIHTQRSPKTMSRCMTSETKGVIFHLTTALLVMCVFQGARGACDGGRMACLLSRLVERRCLLLDDASW